MVARLSHRLIIMLLVGLFVLATGCSDSDGTNPRKTVIAMFGAMEKDDKAALTALLDLSELMLHINEDYALQIESPRVFTSPEQILDDLTGEGLTKKRWFSLQRIISQSTTTGETAVVEVTFVDKEKSRGYRTKFGLHRTNGKWRISSFKTISGG
ncbi:MAG: hypothetical protein KAT79_07580 [candidate division Zixibacteria bacterium]|nr:hypothetical protein [candidate division Zixibacteria bacterium]